MEKSGFGNTVRLTLITAAAGGALALTSCSTEAPAPAVEQSQTAAPQDTLPKVLTDANHDDPSSYKYINVNSITTKTYYGEGYEGDSNSRYNQIQGLSGSEGVTPALQILEVSLGHDKQLHYAAAPEVPEEEKAALLGTVAANDSIIRTAMTPDATGKVEVDKLRFRIYAPDTTGTYSPTSEMEYLPNDPANGNKGTVYYSLPSNGVLDTESVTTMDRHEFLHATLGHEKVDWLSPDAAKQMDDACAILQKDVVTKAFQRSDAKGALQRLIKNASPQFRPAYQKVLDSLKNGTYGDLPVESATPQAPHCSTQNPIKATARVSGQMHLDMDAFTSELLDEQRGLTADRNALGDDWNATISGYTDAVFFSESGYLSHTADNELKGHPIDNSWETAVSTLNCALIDTDRFVTSLKRLPKNVSNALLTIIDVSADVMKQRHPQLYDQQLKPVLDQLATVR